MNVPVEPSSRVCSARWHSPHNGYSLPDPRDRGACARFRLRRKAFKNGSRSSPSTFNNADLQDSVLQLSRIVNQLAESQSIQARTFQNHLVHCNALTQALFVRMEPQVPVTHPPVPCRDETPQPPGGTLPEEAVPIVDQDPAPQSLPFIAPIPQDENSHFSNPLPLPTPCIPSGVAPPPRSHTDHSSFSQSLPRLRGFFNKPTMNP